MSTIETPSDIAARVVAEWSTSFNRAPEGDEPPSLHTLKDAIEAAIVTAVNSHAGLVRALQEVDAAAALGADDGTRWRMDYAIETVRKALSTLPASAKDETET